MKRAGRQLELKYTVFGMGAVGGIVLLNASDALAGVNDTVASFMDLMSTLGAIGMFFAALVANASILVQIPYTLPMLSAAINGASLPHLLVLGLAAGIGAGIGEIISYKIAEVVLTRVPDLGNSRVYQWIEHNTDRRPRVTQLAIFVWAATPLPDDTVIVPLAMIGYGIRRIAAPLFLGKIVHNLVVAWVFWAFSAWAVGHVSAEARTDLALGLVLCFVLVVLYQVEKTRLAGRLAAVVPADPELSS